MKLDKEDAVKFAILYYKLSKVSPNIGVLGTYRRYKHYISKLVTKCRKDKIPVKLNMDKTKLTIMYDDTLVNYIYVGDIDSLTGYYFRKYI